jgi:hypothetical protein
LAISTDVAVMWGRKKREGDSIPERIFVSHSDLTRDADSGEHVAVVGLTFSTGDRYDGYYDSEEWSGPGRDLRPFYWWACMNCDVDGGLHGSLEAATDEARTHTSDVRRGALPSVLPTGPVCINEA